MILYLLYFLPWRASFMKALFLCALAVPLLAACADIPKTSNDEPKEQKIYTTGSNLPQRDRSGVIVLDKDAADQAIRRLPPSMPKTGG